VRGAANATILLDGAGKGWNRAIVTVKGDRLSVTINGKVTTDNMVMKGATSGSGAIGLAPRGEEATQFRNLFVRELK
jgi:hypothetical protein